MKLQDLYDTTKRQPALESVDLSVILRFIDAARRLKPLISTSGSAKHIRASTIGPPAQLPPATAGFLSDVLQIDATIVESLWVATCELIWTEGSLPGDLTEAFISHGP